MQEAPVLADRIARTSRSISPAAIRRGRTQSCASACPSVTVLSITRLHSQSGCAGHDSSHPCLQHGHRVCNRELGAFGHTFNCESVTTVAISMMESLSVSRPVHSRSIQIGRSLVWDCWWHRGDCPWGCCCAMRACFVGKIAFLPHINAATRECSPCSRTATSSRTTPR